MAVDLASVSGDYLDAVRSRNREEALDSVLAPLARGEIQLATFYDEVLAVAAARVGDLWHAGELTVAEEHYATAVNREARLRARQLVPRAASNGCRVVLACAPEEQHELGLLMTGDVLEAAGYEVDALGARTPARDLAAFAETVAADAVLVSCSSPLTIPGLCEAVGRVRESGRRVVVGGRAVRDYPAVADAARADARCTTTAAAVATLEAVLSP